MAKKKITELTFDDFTSVLPYQEVRRILEFCCGKREVQELDDFMTGQTMTALHDTGGIFAGDLQRFLQYRRLKLKGRQMPLDD